MPPIDLYRRVVAKGTDCAPRSEPAAFPQMFRRRDDELGWEDRTLILRSLMRVEAKLESIESLLLEEDDGEDQEGS